MIEKKAKYYYVIRQKEKDSEDDFSYLQTKLENGISMTTQIPSAAQLFSSRLEAEKQMIKWNEQSYCVVKRIKI